MPWMNRPGMSGDSVAWEGWGHVSEFVEEASAELRERAVRMVAEVRGQHETEWAAMRAVAELLGVGTTETVREWVGQAEIDDGSRPGLSTEESAELKRLKRENAELKRANAILKTASAFFAAELDRPHH